MANQAMDECADWAEWRTETLPVDTVFEVLAQSHRRAVVAYLLEHDTDVPVEELVDQLVATDAVDDRNQVHLGLVHKHLPKLADADIVAYHDDTDVVEPCPPIEELRPFVEWAEEFERSQA